MKPTLFGQHTASVFISLVQGHTRAWINSSQSAGAVTQPEHTRFCVIPTNVKTECSVTPSCVAVMSQATGAVSPFGAERGEEEGGEGGH